MHWKGVSDQGALPVYIIYNKETYRSFSFEKRPEESVE